MAPPMPRPMQAIFASGDHSGVSKSGAGGFGVFGGVGDSGGGLGVLVGGVAESGAGGLGVVGVVSSGGGLWILDGGVAESGVGGMFCLSFFCSCIVFIVSLRAFLK